MSEPIFIHPKVWRLIDAELIDPPLWGNVTFWAVKKDRGLATAGFVVERRIPNHGIEVAYFGQFKDAKNYFDKVVEERRKERREEQTHERH